jgi:hypothetical protein
MPLIRLKLKISPFITTDFTGKFVKTLLINTNPELEKIFEDKKYPSPKPLRITPLLEDKKEEPVYPKVVITRFGEVAGKPKNSPNPISINGLYHVYIGYEKSLEPEINLTITKLLGGVELKYGNDVRVKLIEYEKVEQEVPREFNSVKVYFITPAIFVDPFVKVSQTDKDRAKRFIPFPPLIFSVNVYDLFKETYKRNIIRLSYSLIESHTILNTVTKVWYYYDGKWLPGVIGYAKFFLRKGIHKNAKEAVKKILENAIEMGVGSGRAAGFGFVKMKFDTTS